MSTPSLTLVQLLVIAIAIAGHAAGEQLVDELVLVTLLVVDAAVRITRACKTADVLRAKALHAHAQVEKAKAAMGTGS